MALHLRLLQEAPPPAENAARAIVGCWPRRRGRRDTNAFTRQDWVALLSDAESLEAARIRRSRAGS